VDEARPPLLYPLFRPLAGLDGVGPGLAGALRRLLGRDEPRVKDLLFKLPQAERDLEIKDDPTALADGASLAIEAAILKHHPPARPRQPYRIEAAALGLGLDLVFFNAKAPYLERTFAPGTQLRLYGRLQRFRERWQMVHPEIVRAGAEGTASRVYPLVEGLSQARLRRLMTQAMALVPELPEWHDADLLTRHDLPAWRCALARLHGLDDAAPDDDAKEAARRRLALDELFAMQLALSLVRRRQAGDAGRSIEGDGRLTGALLETLPFRPTSAQTRAMGEIQDDLARPRPMMRLLMGDVGSGKTLVALIAMLTVVEAGHQAAFMAPTEVLARQHARTLEAMLKGTGIEVDLLTGQERGRARALLLERLATGAARLVVGTHALFQEGVAFAELGLAVIDEQHRFGVHQRLELVRKGRAVDLLLMTATPIPRSLVLSLYGDIATSRIDERPPGRQPITTSVLSAARLEEVMTAIGRALTRGERIYWICPVIDEIEGETEIAAAETRFETLKARFGEAVALLHGRLGGTEKTARMAAFAAGEVRLLVATTVIEVGIDVPEATVIVIDGAERFGLAQLHQLRGRVGRGDRPSSCLLLYNPPLSAQGRERLKVMRASDDGFTIAEADLRLRGPGEVLGARQSGLPALAFADLAGDTALLETARDEAVSILDADPELAGHQGRALRLLLQLFERHEASGLLAAG